MPQSAAFAAADLAASHPTIETAFEEPLRQTQPATYRRAIEVAYINSFVASFPSTHSTALRGSVEPTYQHTFYTACQSSIISTFRPAIGEPFVSTNDFPISYAKQWSVSNTFAATKRKAL